MGSYSVNTGNKAGDRECVGDGGANNVCKPAQNQISILEDERNTIRTIAAGNYKRTPPKKKNIQINLIG